MDTLKLYMFRGAWLAQSVEYGTLDLGVVSLSPTLGVEVTLKNKYIGAPQWPRDCLPPSLSAPSSTWSCALSIMSNY